MGGNRNAACDIQTGGRKVHMAEGDGRQDYHEEAAPMAVRWSFHGAGEVHQTNREGTHILLRKI